ncbi:hypothetical protein DL96DRAFT_1606683, partial [Flagelloscypha sp. PMI_526]
SRITVLAIKRPPARFGIKNNANDCSDEVDEAVKELLTHKSLVNTGDGKLQDEYRKSLSTRPHATHDWPRDPNGKTIILKDLKGGKYLPHTDFHWGATLLDFCSVYRDPKSNKSFGIGPTNMTISRILAWMKEAGELGTAPQHVEFASLEPNPRRIEPTNILHQVDLNDATCVREGFFTSLLPRRETSKTSIAKSFDWENYPHPWPFVPFSTEAPCIQTRLPLHLLPKQLHVHDPDGILQSSPPRSSSSSPAPVPPYLGKESVYTTYQLSLSGVGAEKMETELNNLQNDLNSEQPIEGLFICPTRELSNSCDPRLTCPPYFLQYPQKPSRPESCPEAHLFLDSRHHLGTGHHSYVYVAEWELPQQILAEPEMCSECVYAALEDTPSYRLSSEFYQVTWDTRESGPRAIHCSSLLPSSPPYAPSSHRQPKAPISLGVVTYRQGKERVRAAPTLVGAAGQDPRLVRLPGETSFARSTRISKANVALNMATKTTSQASYTGPLRIIQSDVPWHIPGLMTPCDHLRYSCLPLRKLHMSRPTVTVRVAVKLTRPGDDHLFSEARHYQEFPSHFFEHWSGYARVPPALNPVPVGAIVPQFYGYYRPKPQEIGIPMMYHMPLMLLEHCGQQVDPRKASLDDKHEYISLLERFHAANWIHNSVYPRNVLMQPGPLDTSLLDQRLGRYKPKTSFRLIDFGRSFKTKDPDEFRKELQSGHDELDASYFPLLHFGGYGRDNMWNDAEDSSTT